MIASTRTTNRRTVLPDNAASVLWRKDRSVNRCALSARKKSIRTYRILEDQGYTRVEITGYWFFACDDHDTFSTGFKAISPAGHEVTGVVCAGVLKKATIRLD